MVSIERRVFGKTGWSVSTVGFGAWQLGSANGGEWTGVDPEAGVASLNRYLDAGGNFIDTADVYGGGLSEKTIAEVLRTRAAEGRQTERVYVVTKAGRSHGDPEHKLSTNGHSPANYTPEALEAAVEGSRRRLGVACLDLVQLHCPPRETLVDGAVFATLRRLREQGKIAHWGASVETVEEAHLCIAQPDCASIQIIYNALRLKPEDTFLAAAAAAQVAVIARLPLASGLLAKGAAIRAHLESLPSTDHRVFNRSGAAFDKGESLSGLGEHLDDAVYPAVARLAALVPESVPMSAFYLRFALNHPAVVVTIPGMRSPAQVDQNITASALPAPTADQVTEIHRVYDEFIRPLVHEHW
eukprot:m.238385 g.238385  ORF g.238385 m.238385 type:complete len:356 (+) comp21753_c0_seq1:34-1101(+)